jgi:hypothetical protein
MAITLNGTTGITTPDIDSTAGFDAADITGTISQSQLAGEAVNESKLQVSNAPTNGYVLTAQSGNTGGLTWAEAASGHWVNLAEVTLGGSQVSAIDITLPTGYDQLKLEIVFPTPIGSTGKDVEMQILNSSNSAQGFSYFTTHFKSDTTSYSRDDGRYGTDFVLSETYGENSGDRLHYSFVFSDTDSTTLGTRYQAQGFFERNSQAAGYNILSGAYQYGSTAASSKLRFKLAGSTTFNVTSACYYRLYGHTYS